MPGTELEVAKRFKEANQAGRIDDDTLDWLKKKELFEKITPWEHEIKGPQTILIAVMPDDSGSIDLYGNVQNMRDGHNTVIDALKEKEEIKEIVSFRTQYLNGHLLNEGISLDSAQYMDNSNYDPKDFGGTPLYDRTAELLITVFDKTEQLKAKGKQSRFSVLLVTDADNRHSEYATASDVKRLVNRMNELSTSRYGQNTISLMGLPSPEVPDFREVAKAMGIEDGPNRMGKPVKRVFTPSENAREIRHSFDIWTRGTAAAPL